jgi:serine phosphatase RsbU (regulator of sigma subunit)
VANQPVVLVVDDEAFNIDYLFQELEDFGVSTISAENGIEALKQVAAHAPDLVLLDIMMPKMDGFAVLAKMKSEQAFRDIPVIIISANSDMRQVLKGIEMGAEDYLPKPFDPLLLKARVNASLEKKRLRNLEKEYLKGLERELDIGRQIQAGFLPKEIISPPGWEVSAFFRAAKEVAGDFYDVFPLEEGRLALIIGDVTDKGVGAALYMALYRSLLRAYLSTTGFAGNGVNGLSEAAAFVNNYICRVHLSVMYLTAFLAVLEPTSGRLSYVSAGHDFPLVLRKDGKVEQLTPTGPAIGIVEDREYGLGELQLGAGDGLLAFTDGLLDIRNRNGESFGGPRLRALVDKRPEGSGALLQNIISEVDDFAGGAEQYDDITILGLSRTE